MSGRGDGTDAVVVPASYDPISYTCVRSLGRRGVHTVVAAERANVPVSSSRFCDEVAVVPSHRGDLRAFRDGLLELAARPDVRTIVPTRPEDSYVLSRYREDFEAHVSLVVPSFDRLRVVHDRLRLYEAACDAGVAVPETRLLDEVERWEDDAIVKSRYNVLVDAYLDSFAPGESAVVKDLEYVPAGSTPDCESLREEMGHEPIVQEFVEFEDEYMFAGLYDHGEPLATFQHRQIRGNSYSGGGGVYRKSVEIPELEEAAHRLLSHLDWHGLACIEYMQDARTDEFVLTEINPRMWQSLPSTVRAGADFPYYCWLRATDHEELIDPSYRVGVGSHLLYGELGHLASILTEQSTLVERPSLPGTAWEVVSSCCREPHFDFLHVDDPGPFVRGLVHVLSKGR